MFLAANLLGRRLRRDLASATVRVEFVNAPVVATGWPEHRPSEPAVNRLPQTEPPVTDEPAAPPEQPGAEPVPERTLLEVAEKTFQLGPTSDEEHRQREETEQRQEQGLLLRVLEENQALRRNLAARTAEQLPPAQADGQGEPENEGY
jgi:hypothetical protein